MRTLTSIEELDFAAPAMAAPVMVQRVTDHALLEGTLAGDEDAFAELVGRYRNQITSYIYPSLSGGRSVSDDARVFYLHLPHCDESGD